MDTSCRSPIRSDRGCAVRRWVVILAFVLLGVSYAQAAPVAVVVHPDVKVDDLSFAEFRKIILADRQFWSAGKRITLIVRAAEADERTVLLKRVYKMSEG